MNFANGDCIFKNGLLLLGQNIVSKCDHTLECSDCQTAKVKILGIQTHRCCAESHQNVVHDFITP